MAAIQVKNPDRNNLAQLAYFVRKYGHKTHDNWTHPVWAKNPTHTIEHEWHYDGIMLRCETRITGNEFHVTVIYYRFFYDTWYQDEYYYASYSAI